MKQEKLTGAVFNMPEMVEIFTMSGIVMAKHHESSRPAKTVATFPSFPKAAADALCARLKW